MESIKFINHFYCFLLVVFIFNTTYSQDSIPKSGNLNSLMIQSVFSDYSPSVSKKRGLLNLKNGKSNPLTYLAAGMLFFYQNIVSEQISADCSYQMSCSEYTKRCIEKFGIIKGTFIGLHQLSCCVPNIREDHCDHKVSEKGKIINGIQ
jgi:putative component of membrane protein insertase Oxa1/YidC/SpoIIIJ protein YidD